MKIALRTTCFITSLVLVACILSLPQIHANSKHYFIGTIQDKNIVSLTLEYRDDGTVRGEYVYLKIGKPLPIEGTLTKSGTLIELREYDEQKNVTGIWDFERKQWSDPIAFTTMYFSLLETTTPVKSVSNRDVIIGEYERDKGDASITVKADGEKLAVSGTAFWGGQTETEPVHIGEFSVVTNLKSNFITISDPPAGSGCKMLITFVTDGLVVTEENQKCGGVNVTFNGLYRKK